MSNSTHSFPPALYSAFPADLWAGQDHLSAEEKTFQEPEDLPEVT